MMNRAILVLWCLFFCVKVEIKGYSYRFMRPTPVLMIRSPVQSTDPSNPLKINKEPTPDISTTGIGLQPINGGIVNPTPVVIMVKTTSASNPIAVPLVKEEPVNKLLTTRPISDNPNFSPLLVPTPTIKVPILSTAAAIPNLINVPVNQPLSTGVIGNVIEPSNVFRVADTASSSSIITPDIEQQEPNKVPLTQVNPSIVQDAISPCTCRSYEEITPTPATPLFTPAASMMSSRRPAHGIQQHFQHIINLQFNLFVNNIPILFAKAQPYYY